MNPKDKEYTSEIDASNQINALQNEIKVLENDISLIESKRHETAVKTGELSFTSKLMSTTRPTVIYKIIFDQFKHCHSCSSIQTLFESSPDKEKFENLKKEISVLTEKGIDRLIELEIIFENFENDFFCMYEFFHTVSDVLLIPFPALQEIDKKIILLLKKYM